MDNKDFEADWTPCEALLKKSCVPPLLPSISAHVCRYCVSPTETKPHKISSIELRHIVPISHKIEQETFIFI